MSDDHPAVEQLPEDGDWKITAGSKKTSMVDVTNTHPPRFIENGRVSSRTRARLQPVEPEGKAP